MYIFNTISNPSLPEIRRAPSSKSLVPRQIKDRSRYAWLTSVILATWEAEAGESSLQISLGKRLERPHLNQ
jgi:hypothetical protein